MDVVTDMAFKFEGVVCRDEPRLAGFLRSGRDLDAETGRPAGLFACAIGTCFFEWRADQGRVDARARIFGRWGEVLDVA